MRRKLTTLEFVEKAIKIHENRYDYSLVDYVDSKTKIQIVCIKHGIFEQKPNDHLNNHGCKLCGINNRVNKQKKDFDKLIFEFNSVHDNKYDYSKIKYFNNYEKLVIICKKHGEFTQTQQNHIKGQGCPNCYGNKLLSFNEFINKSIIIHNNRYDYSKVKYINNRKKITILCKKHGEFEQKPSNHLNGYGCPICKESKGEKKIRKYLEDNHVLFEAQKKFKECKNKYLLPFDFYLPKQNLLIEYDGEQHFKPINFYGISNERANSNFNLLKVNDNIKNTFVKNNNFNLVRIPYFEYDNIEIILNKNK